jgi:putative MATE family efflux protein
VDDHRLTDTLGSAAGIVSSPTSEAAPRPDRPVLDVHRPAWELVIHLAWPALVQQLLILTVSLSDRLLAGRFQHLAAEAQVATQAAQTTANYLAWFLTSCMVLVTVGATTLVAHHIGAGDRRGAVHVLHQALLLAVAFGIVASMLGLVFLPNIVHLLQLHGTVADFAESYLRPLFALLVFQVVEVTGIACLAGAGDTRTGLWVLGGVAVLNLPLAWGIFLGVGPIPGMGFTGIALGTALSHVIGAIAVIVVLLRGRYGLRLDLRLLRPRLDLLRRLLRISGPAGADSLSVAVGQLWFLGIVNNLGDAAKAAHGIAIGWEALGYLSGAAFGTAAMTLVGQHKGGGRPAEAARSGWVAFAMGCGVMTLMGMVFFTLAPQMFRLFCPDPSQEEIVQTGIPALRLVAFAMPALASCIIFTSALRGAGDTRVPVLFTWLGFFGIRLPLAYLLTLTVIDLGPLGQYRGFSLGLMGAWLAMFVDLLVRGLFFLARFRSGRWQDVGV